MSGDVTRIVNDLASADGGSEELLSVVYEELRQMAAAKMGRERPDHTLQATALVNEAFLRLLGNHQSWENRRHFYGAASEAMRRILIDNARSKQAEKRGAGAIATSYDESRHARPAVDAKLLQIHEVLDELAEEDPLKAQIVKLRYFVGLTIPEIAGLLEIGERTVGRHWELARVWLFDAISGDC